MYVSLHRKNLNITWNFAKTFASESWGTGSSYPRLGYAVAANSPWNLSGLTQGIFISYSLCMFNAVHMRRGRPLFSARSLGGASWWELYLLLAPPWQQVASGFAVTGAETMWGTHTLLQTGSDACLLHPEPWARTSHTASPNNLGLVVFLGDEGGEKN